jgi:hypothetical protein
LPGEKRSRVQQLADQTRIAELRLKGHTIPQIVAETKLSRATVMRAMRKATAAWAEARNEALDTIKARELARLDLLEREAFGQWERSKKQHQKKVAEQREGGENDTTVARVETTDQCGDPRYLNTILAIQERRARLLGLDAPHKVTATDVTGEKEVAHYMVAIPAPAQTPEQWAATWQQQLQHHKPH